MQNVYDEPSPRTVVVGAGIIGVSTALNLQRMGIQTTLVDPLPPGEGTSFGPAGILSPSSVVPVPVPGIMLKMPKMYLDPNGPLSLDFLHVARNAGWFLKYMLSGRAREVERIASDLYQLTSGCLEEHQSLAQGTDAINWIKRQDLLHLFENRKEYSKAPFGWDLRKRLGISFSEVSEGELRELEPDVSSGFKFALRLSGHGYALDPSRLVKGLAVGFQDAGGQIIQAEVRDIETDVDGARRLRTHVGTIPFEKLVIAAGAWSAELVARLGVKIPLIAERGYHVQYDDTGIAHNHALQVPSGKFIATPMAQGLRLAGLVEFVPARSPLDHGLTDRLKYHARSLFPKASLGEPKVWLGHRPATPDSLPVIGKVPGHPNVFLAFGHQHIGLMTGPRTGKWVAQMVSGTPPNCDVSSFDPARFNKKWTRPQVSNELP